jgi:hypothetical protein
VTGWSNGSPVRPSYTVIFPPRGIWANISRVGRLAAPPLEGVRTALRHVLVGLCDALVDLILGRPVEHRRDGLEAEDAAAQPRCVSRICPTFIRWARPAD